MLYAIVGGIILIGCILGYLKYLLVWKPLLKDLENFLKSQQEN